MKNKIYLWLLRVMIKIVWKISTVSSEVLLVLEEQLNNRNDYEPLIFEEDDEIVISDDVSLPISSKSKREA